MRLIVSLLSVCALLSLGGGCGSPHLESNCTMNGLGAGECSFTNTGTASGSMCGRIAVARNDGRAGRASSATFCSGEVAARSTTKVEFTIPEVRSLCATAGTGKKWGDVCTFALRSDAEQAEPEAPLTSANAPPGATAQSRSQWKVGDTVTVDIYLVPQDVQALACGLDESFDGLRCAFDLTGSSAAAAKLDDGHLLRPYPTSDGTQVLAAGLWSEPALKGKLPNSRFLVQCRYSVNGIAKTLAVRWAEDGPWFTKSDSPVGRVADCTIATP